MNKLYMFTLISAAQFMQLNSAYALEGPTPPLPGGSWNTTCTMVNNRYLITTPTTTNDDFSTGDQYIDANCKNDRGGTKLNFIKRTIHYKANKKVISYDVDKANLWNDKGDLKWSD